MISERLNFEKKANTLDIDEIKRTLDERAEIETIPNFLNAISQTSLSFNEAIDSEDKDRVAELYEKIRIHDNYLSEKYRSTPEERKYTEAVEQAMEVLKNKIKTLRKADQLDNSSKKLQLLWLVTDGKVTHNLWAIFFLQQEEGVIDKIL